MFAPLAQWSMQSVLVRVGSNPALATGFSDGSWHMPGICPAYAMTGICLGHYIVWHMPIPGPPVGWGGDDGMPGIWDARHMGCPAYGMPGPGTRHMGCL